MDARTHAVSVPGVGEFTFRRREIRDQLMIEADAIRLLGGPVESQTLQRFAMAISTLQRLTVTAPSEWDVAGVDPLDDEAMGTVLKVFGSLRAAEETFRSGARSQRPQVGAAA